ncbi:MAG: beta-propeller domain-containing protein [bacterium]
METPISNPPAHVKPGPTPLNAEEMVFSKIAVATIVLVVAIFGGYFAWRQGLFSFPGDKPGTLPPPGEQKLAVAKFQNEQEFKAWIAANRSESTGYGYGGIVNDAVGLETRTSSPIFPPVAMGKAVAPSGGSSEGVVVAPDRYSETNVQVIGIDEPDLVKNDGSQIYFAKEWYGRYYDYMPMTPVMMEVPSVKPSIMPGPIYSEQGIKILKAFPPADLKLLGGIDKYGNLLLSGKSLVVLSGEGLFGYDVSDPTKPEEKWKLLQQNNSFLVSARLYGDKIYAIYQNPLNELRPCPIVPLMLGECPVEIQCGNIYHPINPGQAEATYSVLKIDPATGEVGEAVSFVGSYSGAVIYMSTNSIYVTYQEPGDVVAYILGFFKANPGYLPSELVAKLEKIQGYDLSLNTKLMEIGNILNRWISSLDSDESLKIENELENKLNDYSKAHNRELLGTVIAKVGLSDLEVKTTGKVPGTLLNQFSMDEYGSNLRVATTIGGRNSLPYLYNFSAGSSESFSDVYVLDANLKELGAVKDLGKTERIYSVRFIEDKGYVVTFRQTDPFYVLDLRNPSKPELKGELKIPGYSGYLHPINKDLIIGIGQEGGQVKVSLFDVADPADPKEAAKYILKEYWSEAVNNHHAFLMDPKHEVFFLPGSQGGYVFSYKNNEFSMVRAVGDIQAKRALYINDYLYILGADQVVVLNENDWQKVNQLQF